MVDGLLVEVVCRNGLLDDLLEDLLAKLLGGDLLAVLCGHDDGVDTLGDDGTIVVLVLDSDLGLGVGSEPWEAAVVAGISHSLVELVREDDGQWKELRGLVSGITEHDTLVASTEILEALLVVETLSNVGALLFNGNENVASLVVKALGGIIVSNVLDGVTDDLLVVQASLGGDFAKDHDHTGLGGRLAGDLGGRVVLQAGIEDGIGNLIGNLVRVTLADRFGGKEESALAAAQSEVSKVASTAIALQCPWTLWSEERDVRQLALDACAVGCHWEGLCVCKERER